MLNIPTFTKYNHKDANKFRNCNKLIAYAHEGSTALYARFNLDWVNCGSYTKDDIVGVSLNEHFSTLAIALQSIDSTIVC